MMKHKTQAYRGTVMRARWNHRGIVRHYLTAGCLALGTFASVSLGAQEVVPAVQTPPATPTPAAPAAEATLRRTIAVKLDNVTLAEALRIVGEQAGVVIFYSSSTLPGDKRVSLTANAITVRDALQVLLEDTGMEAVARAPGLIAVRPTGTRAPVLAGTLTQQGTATISGYIRDSATGASIPQVVIRVDGTTLETKSDGEGEYKITGVSAGEYRVTARRVGYLAKTRTVTVNDGQAVTLNFLLNPPTTKLDEVVTTAVGEQRRYQVGNVISSINVDSIVPSAPVASVMDLISGRAPGVEVIASSGMVGSGSTIRIWGQGSLLLQSDPIIIVDGMRVDNTEGETITAFGNGPNPTPSRINDLDFSQIQTIDILKGPSATTEYGSDAANGVIVITTKRGTSGTAQWHVSAEQSASQVPENFPNLYYSWGHTTDGHVTSSSPCTLVPEYDATVPQYAPQFGPGEVYGTCLADSITAFNPLNHSATTDIGSGPGAKYDIDVGGGSNVLRYYVAAGLTNDVGGTRLPDVFRSEALGLGFPESAMDPNSFDQRSVRLNTTFELNRALDVQANIAYMTSFQRAPAGGVISRGLGNGPSLPDSAYNWGYGFSPGYDYTTCPSCGPLGFLGVSTNDNTTRWTGGLVGTWRPTSWLVGHSTLGIDHGSESYVNNTLPQAEEYIPSFLSGGKIDDQEQSTDVYTVDLRLTATAALSRVINAVSSVGVQMTDTRMQGTDAEVNDLSASEFTLNAGIPNFSGQLTSRTATLGAYLEEQLQWADRLFLTGALRADEGSNFGDNYGAAVYPKISASWLVMNHDGTTVRVRSAFGPSGQQPPYGANLQNYGYTLSGPGQSGGTATTGLLFEAPGNPELAPERVSEYEGGVDVGLWGNRLTLEATGYSKTTQNALYTTTIGWDLGNESYTENIGQVRNSGIEGTLTAAVVQSRLTTWTVTANASLNTNMLVRLAPGVLPQLANPFTQSEYFAPGYPLYGNWGQHYQYVDRNSDGILEPNELTTDTAHVYEGSSIPREEASVSSFWGFWRNTVSLNALFDCRTGFTLTPGPTYSGSLAGLNEPTAPLWEQASAITQQSYGSYGEPAPPIFDGTYIRFRELSLTYAIPHAWVRGLRLADLSITAAVRNLALWTRYPFGDPEVGTSSEGSLNTASGIYAANNDAREYSGATTYAPLTRNWTVRLNARF